MFSYAIPNDMNNIIAIAYVPYPFFVFKKKQRGTPL